MLFYNKKNCAVYLLAIIIEFTLLIYLSVFFANNYHIDKPAAHALIIIIDIFMAIFLVILTYFIAVFLPLFLLAAKLKKFYNNPESVDIIKCLHKTIRPDYTGIFSLMLKSTEFQIHMLLGNHEMAYQTLLDCKNILKEPDKDIILYYLNAVHYYVRVKKINLARKWLDASKLVYSQNKKNSALASNNNFEVLERLIDLSSENKLNNIQYYKDKLDEASTPSKSRRKVDILTNKYNLSQALIKGNQIAEAKKILIELSSNSDTLYTTKRAKELLKEIEVPK